MKFIAIVTGAALISVVFMYAVVGFLFLHGVEAEPVENTPCDRIERSEGLLWCMARMQAEDDNIWISRGEGAIDD